MKLSFGPVTSKDGKSSDVIAEGPNFTTGEILFGGATILGGLASITIGVIKLVRGAFASGAYAYGKGEDDALIDIGCLDEDFDTNEAWKRD